MKTNGERNQNVHHPHPLTFVCTANGFWQDDVRDLWSGAWSRIRAQSVHGEVEKRVLPRHEDVMVPERKGKVMPPTGDVIRRDRQHMLRGGHRSGVRCRQGPTTPERVGCDASREARVDVQFVLSRYLERRTLQRSVVPRYEHRDGIGDPSGRDELRLNIQQVVLRDIFQNGPCRVPSRPH